MSMRIVAAALAAGAVAAGCSVVPATPGDRLEAARAQAQAAEQRELSFARSMAERDFTAFAEHVAADAVFINGGKPLRGKAAVLERWRAFFDGAQAPFSWAPDRVEALVSASGLAHSEGPVRAPDGRPFARFYSIWRLDPDGRWRIVFDNGYAVTPPVKP